MILYQNSCDQKLTHRENVSTLHALYGGHLRPPTMQSVKACVTPVGIRALSSIAKPRVSPKCDPVVALHHR